MLLLLFLTESDEIFKDLFSIFCMFYFGMKLEAKVVFFGVMHGLNGAVFALGKMCELWREFCDFVMMGFPDNGFWWDVFKKRISFFNKFESDAAEFRNF